MQNLFAPSIRRLEVEPFRIAITGHCDLGDVSDVSFVTHAFVALLDKYKCIHSQGILALSGLAPGADTIFAEVALSLAIPLAACIATSAVIDKYPAGVERDQHFRLRVRSQNVTELPFTDRSSEAYLALGLWLVNSCDLLVAAWNGRPPAKPGGTGDVVAIAQQHGRPVIHIHTIDRTITPLVSALAKT